MRGAIPEETSFFNGQEHEESKNSNSDSKKGTIGRRRLFGL